MSKLSEEDVLALEDLLFDPQIDSPDWHPITALVISGDRPLSTGKPGETMADVASVANGADLEDVGQWKFTTVANGFMVHYSVVSQRQARKMGGRWWPGMRHVAIARRDTRANWVAAAQFFSTTVGRRDLKIETGWKPMPLRAVDQDLLNFARQTSTYFALAKRYSWTVRLLAEGGRAVEFVVSPEEARRVFRWRDKPPQLSRRAALRHWVTRADDDGDRKPFYLRGAVDFVWEGLHCKIVPPKFDRERLIEGRAASE